MATDFSMCKTCGIIFSNPDEQHADCPKCRDKGTHLESPREVLRTLKNCIRDSQVKGEFLRVPQLSQRVDVPEETIWQYIHSGEIDTTGFDDPKVREYLMRKRREQVKANLQKLNQDVQKPEPKSSSSKSSGFHLKSNNDKKR